MAEVRDAKPTPMQATRPITVVTGGSEGLGLELAREFRRRGHDLLLIARGVAGLATAMKDLETAGSGAIELLELDLTRDDAMARLDTELGRLGGHVEVLVNNAGIGASGVFADTDPMTIEALVALNVAVPTRLMRHVLPQMRDRRSGQILNIASLAGYVPGPGQAAYYASKAYLLSLSQAIAAEVRRDGVRVTVATPGPIETRFHAKMGAETALYRMLLPAASPSRVARRAVLGLDLGLSVVSAGLFNSLGAIALRLLPHWLLIPAMHALLSPRRRR